MSEPLEIPEHIRKAAAVSEQIQEQLLIEHQHREAAEAKLSEALDHIRWLQPMAKGWAHAHESVASNHRIVLAADEFLSSTEPPALLKEVERLRSQLQVVNAALEEIETELSAYRSGAPEARLNVSVALEKATEALSQINGAEAKGLK